MTEKSFWEGCVKPGLERSCPGIHINRIENVVGNGIADFNACHKGREIWVELKIGVADRIRVRNAQLIWHAKRIVAGGKSFFIVRKGEEVRIYLSSTIVQLSRKPEHVIGSDGKAMSLMVPRDLALFVTGKPFDWDGIRDAMFGF